MNDRGTRPQRRVPRSQAASAVHPGFVERERGEIEPQRRTGLDFAAYQRQTGPFISQLLRDGELPYLKRLIIQAKDRPDPDLVFERRLEMVLDGLAVGIGRTS